MTISDEEFQDFIRQPAHLWEAYPDMVHRLSDREFALLHRERLSAFLAALPPDLRPQLQELREMDMEEAMRDTDRIMNELVRHMPAMAPTLRVLYAHLCDQRHEDVGHCCEADA